MAGDGLVFSHRLTQINADYWEGIPERIFRETLSPGEPVALLWYGTDRTYGCVARISPRETFMGKSAAIPPKIICVNLRLKPNRPATPAVPLLVLPPRRPPLQRRCCKRT